MPCLAVWRLCKPQCFWSACKIWNNTSCFQWWYSGKLMLISIIDIWQIGIHVSLIFGYSLTAGDGFRGPCWAGCRTEISWGNLSWPQISVPWCWRGRYKLCCIEQLIMGLRLCSCIKQLIIKKEITNFWIWKTY